MTSDARLLTAWVTYVFDHPVTDPAWHWSLEAPIWNDDDPAQTAALLADTFEDAGRLLAPFSDAQLNQGLWFLVSASCSDFMVGLVNPAVALPRRLRVLRSFVPLFEQVMAVRCVRGLAHLDEPGLNPLNRVCYMWWDLLPLTGFSGDPGLAELDAQALAILRRLLAIPHDACRESALHGLGHWRYVYPEASEIVDGFLNHTPGLRPELVAYARSAREGRVQ